MPSSGEVQGDKLSMLPRAGYPLPGLAQGKQVMPVISSSFITCSIWLLKVQLVLCLVHQRMMHVVSA